MTNPADTIRKVLVGKPYALAALTELEQAIADNAVEQAEFDQLGRDMMSHAERARVATIRAEAAEADRDRHIRLMEEMRSKPCYEAFDDRDRLRVQLEQLVTAVEEHKPACARMEADRDRLQAEDMRHLEMAAELEGKLEAAAAEGRTLRDALEQIADESRIDTAVNFKEAIAVARAALDRHTKPLPPRPEVIKPPGEHPYRHTKDTPGGASSE